MYAFISSLGSDGSSAAGAAPAAAGAADAAGADSVFCSLTMRGTRTDLRPTRRRAEVTTWNAKAKWLKLIWFRPGYFS